MASDERRPVLNPVLRFLKDPKPKSVSGGGKNADSIRVSRLETQRLSLANDLDEMIEMSSDQPSFSNKSVIYASMFDDSLAPSWTPNDLFAPERGARIIAPFRNGYLVEIEQEALGAISKVVSTGSRTTDLVDISRVETIRFFDDDDPAGEYTVDETWAVAPQTGKGRAFLIWLMPFSDEGAGEELLSTVLELRNRSILSTPSAFGQLDLNLEGAPQAVVRALRASSVSDSIGTAARLYRQTRRASAAVVVPSRAHLAELVASGTVFRLEPVRSISSTAPGTGNEPTRPLPSDLKLAPVVGVIDGGCTATSYVSSAEAWRAPPFILDGHADHAHGNQVTSLVVQGHDWNNQLSLPPLYCRVGTVQAVPKRESGAVVNPSELVAYLDGVMTAYPEAKVWNLSFNEPAPGSLEDVSYLGHQIALLARKHKILPVISVGNRPGDLLQPPGDCEAGLTIGGRVHDTEGVPARSCPVSLQGPGPAGMLKPEVSNFSHVRVIGGVITAGSSFSAALTSPLAAHSFQQLRDPSPDLVKALILHRSAEGAFDRSIGFGTPSTTAPWSTAPGFVTLQWTASLKPGAAYYWELPIPESLRRTGKLKGVAHLTALLNPHPLVSDFAGQNYFSARLETALQCERHGRAVNLLGSLQSGKQTEEEARTLDHKWCPLRHHSKQMNGVTFEGDSVKIYGRVFTRDLYMYPYGSNEEVPALDVVFVLTLGTGNPEDDLYGEIRSELGTFVEVGTVDIDLDVES